MPTCRLVIAGTRWTELVGVRRPFQQAAVDAGGAYVIAQMIEAGGHVRDEVPLCRLLVAS